MESELIKPFQVNYIPDFLYIAKSFLQIFCIAKVNRKLSVILLLEIKNINVL